VAGEQITPTPPSLLEWYVAALKIGVFSFGGGLAAWMLREFVYTRRWMTEDQFMSDLAIARVFPGTNVSNFLVLSGYRMCGLSGAFLGLLGILTGPFLIIIAMINVYDYLESPILDRALEGAAAAALGLLVFIVVKSVKHMGARWSALTVFAAVTGAVTLFNAPLLPLVVIALPVSLVLHKLDRKPDARQ
jgi:chromate transporter